MFLCFHVKKTVPVDMASKIRLQKFWVTWKHLKRGYWGGENIEDPLKTVDFDKILSQMYLGRIFLKLHI